MKDIPMFTCEYGVASLTLREVPVRGIAYVKIQSSLDPELLMEECRSFCVACGAETVFAAGDSSLERYPVSAEIIRMVRSREGIGETDAAVFPVTEQTVGRWREIYNERMADVPNAAWLGARDEKELLEKGDCYFVHRDGCLLGIGRASGEELDMIASVQPRSGREVALAMASVLASDRISLLVARENTRAVRLYESLGFVAVELVSRWHKIF